MKPFLLTFLVAALAITAAFQDTMSTPSPDEADDVVSSLSSAIDTPILPVARESFLRKEKTNFDTFEKDQARLEEFFDTLVEQQARAQGSLQDQFSDPIPLGRKFSYLAYYVFSEIPPDEKPADTVLKTMKDVPVGTPVEEIKRASDAFGLDFSFMKAVAKIESGFNPKQRTGSYIGLYQLSKFEFKR